MSLKPEMGSFIYSTNMYWAPTVYDTVPGAGDTAVNNTDIVPGVIGLPSGRENTIVREFGRNARKNKLKGGGHRNEGGVRCSLVFINKY